MSETDDEEVLEVIRRHARQLAIQSGGEAKFRDVMLSLGKELDANQVRALIPTIKKEIEDINSRSLEELKELDEEDEESLVENEYDELVQALKEKLDGKSYVRSLLAYGSYGKGNHIMGQSNLNFLLVLKDLGQQEEEKVGKEIQEIIESLMNPLFEYLLDIVVLFDHDVKNIESFKGRMGPGFSLIHAYSASKSTPIIGDNPFISYNFDNLLKPSAEMILKDTIRQYQAAKQDLESRSTADTKPQSDEKPPTEPDSESESEAEYEESEENKEEDLAYLTSEAVIDCALALIYFTSTEHITKPDVREKFTEYFDKDKQLRPYISTVEKAFAYRMGITKIGEDQEITDEELIKEGELFITELQDLLGKTDTQTKKRSK